MANSKLTGLSATTTPVSTDIFYIVTDPGGTPTSLKVTGANMGKALTVVGKVAVTQPASSATLTLTDGKTLSVSNSLTLAGTDSTTMTFPSSSTTVAGLSIAQTFTATQTITPASNTSTLVSTGYSVTGSGTTNMVSLAGTLNTSGVTDVILLNLTNTASGTGSKLVNLKVGGSSVFSVGTNGSVITSGDIEIPTAKRLFVSNGSTTGNYILSGASASLNTNSTAQAGWNGSGFYARRIILDWANADIAIDRSSSTALEINSTTPGTFRDLKLRNIVGQTGYSEMTEITAPGAGAANTVRIYAEDNGSGKTRLMAIFPSGAAQQIAIEP